MKTRSRRSRKSTTLKLHHGICCEVTMHGLNKWYESVFERLGWMILAKKHGYSDKIHAYKSEIQRLKMGIEHKLTHVHEIDRKTDLMILHENILELEKHVNEDFKGI